MVLPTTCPRCQAALEVVRLRCSACATQIDGTFALPEILRLEPKEQRLLLDFVLASGSLKKVAAQYGLSYPTIRNRLDDLIAKLQGTKAPAESDRMAILDAIAAGSLSVAEGAKRLREIKD
ncbi:MAG: DUF2089 domain-containing protein [Myxococcales bacterium FL481]|nr:MAG: DUF2089 domain-containing protein [Myxococcales bacterium FL481]